MGPHRRHKRARIEPLSFLSLEADVTNDVEESEDEESEDDFIQPDGDFEDDPEVYLSRRACRGPAELFVDWATSLAEMAEKEAEALHQRAETCYRQSDSHDHRSTITESLTVAVVGEATRLWRVPVRAGKEADVTFAIMRKMVASDSPAVKAAIASPRQRGFILVEAQAKADVIELIRGLNFISGAVKITRLSEEEQSAQLQAWSAPAPCEDGWARYAGGGHYCGDLAWVQRGPQGSTIARIWLVPRIQHPTASGATGRPPKALFHEAQLIQHGGRADALPDGNPEKHTFRFAGRQYHHGFLILLPGIEKEELVEDDVGPTPEEVVFYRASPVFCELLAVCQSFSTTLGHIKQVILDAEAAIGYVVPPAFEEHDRLPEIIRRAETLMTAELHLRERLRPLCNLMSNAEKVVNDLVALEKWGKVRKTPDHTSRMAIAVATRDELQCQYEIEEAGGLHDTAEAQLLFIREWPVTSDSMRYANEAADNVRNCARTYHGRHLDLQRAVKPFHLDSAGRKRSSPGDDTIALLSAAAKYCSWFTPAARRPLLDIGTEVYILSTGPLFSSSGFVDGADDGRTVSVVVQLMESDVSRFSQVLCEREHVVPFLSFGDTVLIGGGPYTGSKGSAMTINLFARTVDVLLTDQAMLPVGENDSQGRRRGMTTVSNRVGVDRVNVVTVDINCVTHSSHLADAAVDSYVQTSPTIDLSKQDPTLQTKEQAQALAFADNAAGSLLPNSMTGRVARDLYVNTQVKIVKGAWKGYTGRVIATRYLRDGAGLILDVKIDRTYQRTIANLTLDKVVELSTNIGLDDFRKLGEDDKKKAVREQARKLALRWDPDPDAWCVRDGLPELPAEQWPEMYDDLRLGLSSLAVLPPRPATPTAPNRFLDRNEHERAYSPSRELPDACVRPRQICPPKQSRVTAPPCWLNEPKLLGKRLDIILKNTHGTGPLTPWRNGKYENRMGFIICDTPWPRKNVDVRLGIGHAMFTLNIQYIAPMATTEHERGPSAADAKPILGTPGVQVVIIGPDLNGDTSHIGTVAIVKSGDGNTGVVVGENEREIWVSCFSVCRSSPGPSY